jgi:hypothetical protein
MGLNLLCMCLLVRFDGILAAPDQILDRQRGDVPALQRAMPLVRLCCKKEADLLKWRERFLKEPP